MNYFLLRNEKLSQLLPMMRKREEKWRKKVQALSCGTFIVFKKLYLSDLC
jgi:hypothetical protein